MTLDHIAGSERNALAARPAQAGDLFIQAHDTATSLHPPVGRQEMVGATKALVGAGKLPSLEIGGLRDIHQLPSPTLTSRDHHPPVNANGKPGEHSTSKPVINAIDHRTGPSPSRTNENLFGQSTNANDHRTAQSATNPGDHRGSQATHPGGHNTSDATAPGDHKTSPATHPGNDKTTQATHPGNVKISQKTDPGDHRTGQQTAGREPQRGIHTVQHGALAPNTPAPARLGIIPSA